MRAVPGACPGERMRRFAVMSEETMPREKAVEDVRSGKGKAIGALVGQTMKATQGKANPAVVNKLLKELL